ncbi:hypothetical protein KI387_030454, partial [Taxus chinensis]
KFMMIFDASIQLEQMIYARICVLMDLNNPLPAKILLVIDKEEWEQILDYENIPFRCHLCHEYGHLVKDYPAKMPESKEAGKNKEEFVISKKKQVTKKYGKDQLEICNSNRYASLQEETEEQLEDLVESQVPETQLDKPIYEANKQKMDTQNQLVVFQGHPQNNVDQNRIKSYQRKTKFNEKV